MRLISSKKSTSFLLSLLLSICTVFSVSAFAASSSFSFIEFNIAFVLGLSLPVLLILSMVKPIQTIKRRFAFSFTSVLLLLLYTLVYVTGNNVSIILSLSAIFLVVGYFWLLHHAQPNRSISSTFIYLIIASSLAIFLVSLWFGLLALPWLWLLFSTVILLTIVSSIFLFRQQAEGANKQHLITLWLINIAFAAAIYFWLVEGLSVNVVIIASVLTYVATMVDGCWQVVSKLITDRKSQASSDDIKVKSNSLAYDPVTNLPIYHQALRKLEQELHNDSSARYAAIVFKPTNFQQVNAVLGHKNSDLLLLQFAYCLQTAVEHNEDLIDFSPNQPPIRIARLQGLHFLIVMDVSRSKHDDKILIEQLCSTLTDSVPGPMSFKSFSLHFQLAFGAAFSRVDSNNASEIIACAEDALLTANPRQSLVSYFDQQQAIFNQQQLQKMEMLKHEIASKAITWYAQPQVELASKRITGFELCTRWQAYESVSEFINLAEQSGDIYALTKQMIMQAFVFLAELERLEYSSKITVKLSSSSLLEPDLVEFIEAKSRHYHVGCEHLIVEIKEDIIFNQSQQAKAMIDQLKSLGIDIAIGEFSGSYEALRYLRRLSIDQIKIDCQLLATAEAGSSDKAIINALINLTRKMELPLIGTNVGTKTVEAMYMSLGGEFAQGKLYNSGIKLADLSPWLSAWQKQYPPSV